MVEGRREGLVIISTVGKRGFQLGSKACMLVTISKAVVRTHSLYAMSTDAAGPDDEVFKRLSPPKQKYVEGAYEGDALARVTDPLQIGFCSFSFSKNNKEKRKERLKKKGRRNEKKDERRIRKMLREMTGVERGVKVAGLKLSKPYKWLNSALYKEATFQLSSTSGGGAPREGSEKLPIHQIKL